MEDAHFDALTRAVARGVSRRRVLRGLMGGLAAAGLGLAGRHSAAAFICRHPGVLCAKDAHCCSEICGEDHRCACPDGGTLCGRDCLDTSSDPANCGGCGLACTAPANATATCTDSTCGFTCNDDLLNCGDSCQGCCGPDDCPSSECIAATCDGGHCGANPLGQGVACGSGPVCYGESTAKLQDTCDGTGQCGAGDLIVCSPYVCRDGACLSSCADSNDCSQDDFYCASGTCTHRKAPGSGCSKPEECVSGFCVAGVCCDTACTGSCQTCTSGACQSTGTACGETCCAGETPYCDEAGSCVCTATSCTGGTSCCHGACVTLNPTTCPNGNECATGFDCVHGGCFRTGSCVGSCTGSCAGYAGVSTSAVHCLNTGTSVGTCFADADCPAGTLCSFLVNGSQSAFLCTLPCTYPAG